MERLQSNICFRTITVKAQENVHEAEGREEINFNIVMIQKRDGDHLN